MEGKQTASRKQFRDDDAKTVVKYITRQMTAISRARFYSRFPQHSVDTVSTAQLFTRPIWERLPCPKRRSPAFKIITDDDWPLSWSQNVCISGSWLLNRGDLKQQRGPFKVPELPDFRKSKRIKWFIDERIVSAEIIPSDDCRIEGIPDSYCLCFSAWTEAWERMRVLCVLAWPVKRIFSGFVFFLFCFFCTIHGCF